MKELLFITSNKNKLKEVKSIIGGNYKIISLEDIEYRKEIPEPFDTIDENSKYKANYFFDEYGVPCIAEDSGLVVNVLNGMPGAYSARYAGDEKNDQMNIEKVLSELIGIQDRTAMFKSVFTYKDSKTEIQFVGEMIGNIIDVPKGDNGFGYDPIFIAEGQVLTNAELTQSQKNEISHRKKALNLCIDFLENYIQD